jgi:N-alpha-acetyltransferase 15/16, NatA auxiliary subunit
MIGEQKRALELIDKAIEHTPTLEDLYFIKAKFAKHVGDLVTAHRLVDKARSIDIADRYMNTKAAVYALRAGNFEAAEETAFHFAKELGKYLYFYFFIFYFLSFFFFF